MATQQTGVSVWEYLHNTYDPDCDYVDGELEERNVGEKDHSKAQRKILVYFTQRETELGIFVIQEQRLRVSPTRYRVPDICVMYGPEPDEQVFTSPPLICIEILSPEDRMGRMLEKVRDYLAFGVRYVWILDIRSRKAYVHTAEGMREVTGGVLATEDPKIELPLAEIFEGL